MNGYRIVFKKSNVADIESFDVREPKDNELMIKVEYTLISSGTEKAYLSGSKNTAHKFPTTPGYSSVGTVIKIGNSVKDFKVGDRVFVAYGGHANFNTKAASSCVRIPDAVPFEDAVFTRLASFPMLAIRRARLEIGESVVIVGLGMLGLFGCQIASIGGGHPVIAVGNRDIRRELARKFGADYVFSPDQSDLTGEIYRITENLTGVKGANVIIETSGTESGLIKCLEYTSMRGRVLLNGCNRVMSQPVDFYKYVHLRGVNIIGAHDNTRLPYNSSAGNWTPVRDYITLLRFMSNGKLTPNLLNPSFVDPTNATQVYDRLLNDRNFPLGVIFDWTKI